jgi:hypothetical protein
MINQGSLARPQKATDYRDWNSALEFHALELTGRWAVGGRR